MELANFLSSYIRIIDVLLGAVILWGMIKGYQRGFLLELVSLVIFIASVSLIFFFVGKLFFIAEGYLGNLPKSSIFILYLFLYIAGTIALNFLGKVLDGVGFLTNSVFDDLLDNIMGMVVGALKYSISLSLIIGMFDSAGLRLPAEVVKDSYIYPLLLRLQDWLVEVAAVLMPSIGELAEQISRVFKRK